MKAMKCEMCNSNDIVKEGEFYVCQSCGTKYTVEAAKKLIVEGTVTIDNSSELESLKELASRAMFNSDYENAQKYYEKALIIAPNDWEVYFFSNYCRAKGSGAAERRKPQPAHALPLTPIIIAPCPIKCKKLLAC